MTDKVVKHLYDKCGSFDVFRKSKCPACYDTRVDSNLNKLLIAARELDEFAWSAITCDCKESTKYLQCLLLNLRAALTSFPR